MHVSYRYFAKNLKIRKGEKNAKVYLHSTKEVLLSLQFGQEISKF